MPNQVNILAKTLWAECRGEPFVGQIAVACVIRNRVNDPRWPNDWAGVCLQPRQFSCWDGQAGKRLETVEIVSADPAWARALDLAKLMIGDLKGLSLPDITGGANHYINTFAAPPEPDWASRHTDKITLWPGPLVGRHAFYRL